jgi:hypothetical protein
LLIILVTTNQYQLTMNTINDDIDNLILQLNANGCDRCYWYKTITSYQSVNFSFESSPSFCCCRCSPEDWGLRYAAVVSLAEIATPEALVALEQALTQETDKVVLHRITTALESLEVGVG